MLAIINDAATPIDPAYPMASTQLIERHSFLYQELRFSPADFVRRLLIADFGLRIRELSPTETECSE
jgi:hypothetical protein